MSKYPLTEKFLREHPNLSFDEIYDLIETLDRKGQECKEKL